MNVFKVDTELNFIWSKSLSELFTASQGFELDSSETYLYFNFAVSQCIFVKMYTTNGTLAFSKQISDTESCDSLTLSSDGQYTYNLFQNGKLIKLIKEILFWVLNFVTSMNTFPNNIFKSHHTVYRQSSSHC